MQVRLRAMTEAAYAAWRPGAIAHYAELNAAAQGVTAEEAQVDAEKQFGALLPDGVETAEHHLLVAFSGDGAGNERVGMLWLLLKQRARGVQGFVYEVAVEEGSRGRGYGRAIMEAGEDYAHQRGAVRIGLHVHASNTVARALYEHLDYETTDLTMSKSLSRATATSAATGAAR